MSLDNITPEMWDKAAAEALSYKAHEVLDAAKEHMEDRADTYDCPEGERSMEKIVLMFNNLVDTDLSEEQGWLFMAIVKMVRSQQGSFNFDSYEDGAAYFALAGEAGFKERKL